MDLWGGEESSPSTACEIFGTVCVRVGLGWEQLYRGPLGIILWIEKNCCNCLRPSYQTASRMICFFVYREESQPLRKFPEQ